MAIEIETIVVCVFSGIALFISAYTYYKSRREGSYADLDSLYLELLKLGIEYPQFVNGKNTNNYKESFKGGDFFRYETYAFISWNICETIYDRQDDVLYETWRPVIVAENKLHRSWFNQPENHHKFKDSFRDFIQKEFPE